VTVELSEGIDPARPLCVTFSPVYANDGQEQILFVKDFFDALLVRVLFALERTHINDGLYDNVVELPDG